MVLGPALLVATIATSIGPAPAPPRPAPAPREADIVPPPPNAAPIDPAAVRARGQRAHEGDLRNPFSFPPSSRVTTTRTDQDLKDPFAPRPRAQATHAPVRARDGASHRGDELIDPFPGPPALPPADAPGCSRAVPVQRPRSLAPMPVRCDDEPRRASPAPASR